MATARTSESTGEQGQPLPRRRWAQERHAQPKANSSRRVPVMLLDGARSWRLPCMPLHRDSSRKTTYRGSLAPMLPWGTCRSACIWCTCFQCSSSHRARHEGSGGGNPRRSSPSRSQVRRLLSTVTTSCPRVLSVARCRSSSAPPTRAVPVAGDGSFAAAATLRTTADRAAGRKSRNSSPMKDRSPPNKRGFLSRATSILAPGTQAKRQRRLSNATSSSGCP
jgi:hypothetical protein